MSKVLNKIGKDIWAYLACIFVVILVWSWIFNSITKIKTEEKVCVFIGAYTNSFEKANELNDIIGIYKSVSTYKARNLPQFN